MSVNSVFSAGIIQCHDVPLSSAVKFAGLVSKNIELGNEVRTQQAAASIYERTATITRRAPSFGMATTQIATALDLIGSVGRCITADGTHPGLDAYLVAHDEFNHRDLTASQRYRMTKGLLVPESLSVEHRGIAQLAMSARASYDGTNEPLQVDEDITLPTGAVDTEQFTLYQQTIQSVTLTGVKQMAIEFGVQVTEEDADGSIFPEWLSVGSVVTRIRLGGINPKWLASGIIPIAGKPLTHAGTTLRMIKCLDGGSYAPLASAVHIGITVAGLGTITTAASAGDGNGVAGSELVLIAVHDGTNVPLVIDTTFALA